VIAEVAHPVLLVVLLVVWLLGIFGLFVVADWRRW
jgi:hypothetical protein